MWYGVPSARVSQSVLGWQGSGRPYSKHFVKGSDRTS